MEFTCLFPFYSVRFGIPMSHRVPFKMTAVANNVFSFVFGKTLDGE